MQSALASVRSVGRRVGRGFGHVRVAQISASWYQSCALLVSGKIRCWGNAGDGRLGYANNETIGDDESPIAAGDVQLGGLVLSVATGPDHTCAVLEGGKVRCFGKNDDYQLGYSSPASIGDDELPESAFYMVGTIEDAVDKARQAEAVAA